jgi:hypothetical protein
MERKETRKTKSKEKGFQAITISEHVQWTPGEQFFHELITGTRKQIS